MPCLLLRDKFNQFTWLTAILCGAFTAPFTWLATALGGLGTALPIVSWFAVYGAIGGVGFATARQTSRNKMNAAAVL